MTTRRSFLKTAGLALPALGLGSLPVRDVSGDRNAPGAPGDWTAGLPSLGPEDYEARLEKARRFMSAERLDGLLVGGGANLVYFSGVAWGLSERPFGLVIGRRTGPAWVCPAFELDRARELIPAGQKVRTWEEHESPYALVSGIFDDWGARGGRLGLAPDLRSFEVHGLRREAAGLELVDGAPVTQGCRAVKSAKEIEFMDLANRITKLAYREAFAGLSEGMSQRDLAAAVASATQRMGAAGGGWPQFGPATALPHGSRLERKLAPGDVVMVDGGCGVRGYRSDVTRTVVYGAPTERQRKVWNAVLKAQAAAQAAVRPGVPCRDVDRAARKVIEEAGFGPGYKHFAHRLGHGIGLEGHEHPYLVEGNALRLEPGMTFSNEPGIYIAAEFGVRLEDCFVVTEDGSRILGGAESVSLDPPYYL
ncbi:MAG: aminopeptidase P family protein [Candidatus Aminicenantes bacterium]|nr:aminopeptidase P family protein [Candidatus Aminicenantes bacterium]